MKIKVNCNTIPSPADRSWIQRSADSSGQSTHFLDVLRRQTQPV